MDGLTSVVRADRSSTTGRVGSVVDHLVAVESYLWAILVATLFVDVLLTHYGLQVGLSEGNPLMRFAIETAGIAALAAAKVLIVVVGVGVRRSLDEQGVVVPLGLALPWFVAASINASYLV
jgi:hypothetical protein